MKVNIDNVKAKIDNVKAKIQDKEEKEPWSRPTLARCLVFGQLATSPTSFPLEGSLRLARQLPASHDESPPHTTSPVLTGVWAETHDSSIATDTCRGTNLHVIPVQQLVAMQAARPGKSINAGLTSCATITSPSSPTLPHASSA
jgi:hypothetical protein